MNSCSQSKGLERSISIYDNVDIKESIEAAKRLSAIDISQNRPNSRQSRQLSGTHSPESLKFQPKSNEDKQKTERKQVFEDSFESTKTLSQNDLKPMTETKELIIDESISHITYSTSQTDSQKQTNGSTDIKHNLYSIQTKTSSEFETLGTESSLNASLNSDLVEVKEQKSYLKNEFFSQSMVRTIETTVCEMSGSSSALQNTNSVQTIDRKEEVFEENEESLTHLENKTESNGQIGSRTSPLRTVYKRNSEKRESSASLVSPTSPVRGSLIPRYIANTPNQNSMKFQTRNESNNSSQIKNSFVKNKSSDETTKLRIFVPYSHSDRNNDNKIQLRVDSPTLQLKKSDPKCLPTVDT